MKLFIVFIVFGDVFGVTDIHRSKRFLIFPPTSPTRMQIIAGIGIPVQLDYESVTFGYTFKAEWFLADNTTITGHFQQDPWNPITRPISNRRRRHALLFANNEHKLTHDPIEIQSNETENSHTSNDRYEKYDVEAIEIDSGLSGIDTDDDNELDGYGTDENDENLNDFEHDEGDEDESGNPDEHFHSASSDWNTHPKDLSAARWTLFKGIEILAQRKGLAGRPCMLRSICESAQAPFSVKSGILGELMHIIMTPSLTEDKIVDHTQNEYLRAEEIGRSGAPCEKVFKECTTSVLDQFSGIYSTVGNLIKLFG